MNAQAGRRPGLKQGATGSGPGDASYTPVHATGALRHIEAALQLGATREKIIESLKFCVACTTSLLRWLWNDLLRLLPVAIFFLVGFNLIVLADKLMVFKHKTVAAAHQYAMHEVALPHFWGTEIWVAVLLLMFVTAQELIHAVGRDQIRRMFFGR